LVWRRIGGVLAGLVIAIVIVQIAEMGVHAMNPLEPKIEHPDMATIKEYVAQLPPSALVLVLVGWLVGTFSGTFTAARIARTRTAAYVAGAILFCLGVVNAFMIPQPAWFSVASLAIYVIGTITAARTGFTASSSG